MKSNYIPEILKEKFLLFLNYLYGILLFFISIISALALFSFDINENSFLTSSNEISENLVGNFGSYYASFVLYVRCFRLHDNCIFFDMFNFSIFKKTLTIFL